MKKKSIFATLACLSLAVVLCFALVGCGLKPNAGEKVKGETVTAEQWNKALAPDNTDYENFKVEYVKEETVTVSAGSFTVTTAVVITKVKDAYYSEVKITTSGDKKLLLDERAYDSSAIYYYGPKAEGQPAQGFEFTGKWTKSYSAMSKTIGYIGSCLLTGSYEDYEYSDDYKGYVKKDSVCKGELNGLKVEEAAVYKFKDGKYAAFWAIEYSKADVGGTNKTTVSAVITYGGQSIPASPSEAEWKDAYGA